MRNLAKALVGLSALAYVCAAAGAFTGPIMNFTSGTLGRASLGLAALAIAVVLVFDGPSATQSK